MGVRRRWVRALLIGAAAVALALALAATVSLASFRNVGGSLNFDAAQAAHNPSIAAVGGVPYVAWEEPVGAVGQIRVRRFDGANWLLVGGPLNADTGKNAVQPSLPDFGGVPYGGWGEVG